MAVQSTDDGDGGGAAGHLVESGAMIAAAQHAASVAAAVSHNGASSTTHSSSSSASPSLQNHPHHPFRLEVSAVTPVSVLFLWSLRPPPLSAMPRSSTAAGRVAKATQQQQQQQNVAGSEKQSASTSTPSQTQHVKGRVGTSSGVQRNDGLLAPSTSNITATRGPNRKVTKVTLRNISPAKRQLTTSKSSEGANGTDHACREAAQPSKIQTQRRDSEDWPSDDGATVVDDDDARGDMDGGEHDEDVGQDSQKGGVPSAARTLDSGVTVAVNSIPWSHVVMGEGGGADEVFIVVYGLAPARSYEILLTVEGKQNSLSLATADACGDALVDEASAAAPAPAAASSATAVEQQRAPTAAGQVARIRRTHTPPMQDTDADLSGLSVASATSHSLPIATPPVANQGTSLSSSSTLQATVRKARKDASRAESAMRHEIEAIKRGLERMGDVDHRSKQKVLALQESIRQATLHTKSIEEEAAQVEDDREAWETREREKDDELEQIRRDVEGKVRLSEATIKANNDEVAAMERELARVTKGVEEKRTTRDQIEHERIGGLEQELLHIQNEIDKVLKQPSPAQSQALQQQQQQLLQQQHPHPYQQHSSQPGSHHSPVMGFYGLQGPALHPAHQHHMNPASFGALQMSGRNNRGRGGSGPARGGHRGGVNLTWRGSGSHVNHARQTHPGSAHLPASSTGHASDEQHHILNEHGLAGLHSTVLNPHNPEFVPSGIQAGSASASPITGRAAFPSQYPEHAPSDNAHLQFPFPASTLQHAGRRGSYSVDSTGYGNVGEAGGLSAGWAYGRSPSPWAQHPGSVASSPLLGHDIWGTGPVSSPRQNTSPLAGVALPSSSSLQGPALGLGTGASGRPTDHAVRNKTSIPFGLNASLLRGGASPSFTHHRLGDRANSGDILHPPTSVDSHSMHDTGHTSGMSGENGSFFQGPLDDVNNPTGPLDQPETVHRRVSPHWGLNNEGREGQAKAFGHAIMDDANASTWGSARYPSHISPAHAAVGGVHHREARHGAGLDARLSNSSAPVSPIHGRSPELDALSPGAPPAVTFASMAARRDGNRASE